LRSAPGRAAEPRRGTGELEQLLAIGGATWRLRATAARHGGAGKSQQGLGERRAGELEGQVVGLERRGAAGSAGACRQGAMGGGAEQQRETEREGREEGDEDFCIIFQKSKWCTVKYNFISNHSQKKICPKAKV
jgi:hypothetical protein